MEDIIDIVVSPTNDEVVIDVQPNIIEVNINSSGAVWGGITGTLSNQTDLQNALNAKQNALTNPITGSLTTNYLPKATGATTLGNSLIYDNGTNVGIGTTSPSKSLHVIGSSLNSLSGQSIEINPFWDSGYGAIGTTSNHHLALVTNSSEKIRITSGGNVGIGTSNPTSQVDILSNKALFSGTSLRVLIDSNTNQGFFGVDGTGTGGTSDKIYFGGRGDSNEGFIGSFSNLNFQTAYSNRMIITSGGNVGIGTTSPSVLLDVNGLIKAGQYTTGTEPAYVKGAIYFNTTLNKYRIGGASAWETVTSI